jgi:dTDP-D-glucose 4,6-dehydratase
MKNVLVTSGFGFIGSNFIRSRLKNKDFDRTINYDK